MTIRPMQAADIDAVLALEQAIPQAPHWSRAAWEQALDPASQPLSRSAFVAEGNSGLIGFAIAKFVAGTAELESIAVDPEARGKGIGTALLNAVISWAQTHRAERVELEVRASNQSAIRLYERAGFQREGLRRNYYHAPDEDALLMVRSSDGGKLS